MSMELFEWDFVDTYVDAVLVRLVIIGLGNWSCELLIQRFGELSGDDIVHVFLSYFLNKIFTFSYNRQQTKQ